MHCCCCFYFWDILRSPQTNNHVFPLLSSVLTTTSLPNLVNEKHKKTKQKNPKEPHISSLSYQWYLYSPEKLEHNLNKKYIHLAHPLSIKAKSHFRTILNLSQIQTRNFSHSDKKKIPSKVSFSEASDLFFTSFFVPEWFKFRACQANK